MASKQQLTGFEPRLQPCELTRRDHYNNAGQHANRLPQQNLDSTAVELVMNNTGSPIR
jgi:hypothetical protein